MAKYLLTNGKVMIAGVNLSDHAFSVDTPDEREQVDVSGFSPTGTKEYLPGSREQEFTVGFLQDFASGSVHQTLSPLYSGGSTFVVSFQPDASAGTSAANPIFGGTAKLYSYNGANGALNDRGEVEATFKPSGSTGFAWGTVAP